MTLTDERPDKSSQRRNSVEVVTASNYRLDRLTLPLLSTVSFSSLFLFSLSLSLSFRHASPFSNNIREFLTTKVGNYLFFLFQIVIELEVLKAAFLYLFFSLSLSFKISLRIVSSQSNNFHRFMYIELKFQFSEFLKQLGCS